MEELTSRTIQSYPLGDCLVLLNRRTSRLTLINATARLVWESLQDGKSRREIAAWFAGAFGISVTAAARDIEALFQDWRAQELLPNACLAGDATWTQRPDPSNGRRDAMPLNNRAHARRLAPKAYRLTDETFVLHTEVAGIEQRIHSLFSHLEVAADREEMHMFEVQCRSDVLTLYHDNQEQGRSATAEKMLELLLFRLLEVSYPGRQWLAMFHAAAVALGDRAVLMPAPSGSGKSTLTAFLMQEPDLEYLGDDIVPLQRGDYRITPLPTRLSIKSGSWDLLRSRYPKLLDGSTYTSRERELRYLDPVNRSCRCPRVHCLLFPQYRPGCGRAEFREISAPEALRRLIESNIWLGHPLLEQNVSVFLEWIQSIPKYALEYTDVADAIGYVESALEVCR